MKNKSDEHWKKNLSDEQYKVLREKGTEAPFSGTLLKNSKTGSYKCAACGTTLFDSGAKYDSKSGWPSFTEAVDGAKVKLIKDESERAVRTEASCVNCGGHLGHVFPDGPGPTGTRYCINSVCLNFEEKINE